MSLPKNLTPSLIRKLNDACKVFRQARGPECDCDEVGWCDPCWIMAGGGSLLFDEMEGEDGQEAQGEGQAAH